MESGSLLIEDGETMVVIRRKLACCCLKLTARSLRPTACKAWASTVACFVIRIIIIIIIIIIITIPTTIIVTTTTIIIMSVSLERLFM